MKRARTEEWLNAARGLGLWGWGSLAAALVAVVAVVVGLPGVFGALLSPSALAASPAAADGARAESFREAVRHDLAQINGRSMFYLPPPPAPPARVVEEHEPEAPPPPAKYGGPGIIAMINGTVWLDNGTKLRLDEASSGGLRVISLSAPWGARIEWSGKEWDVPLFDRTTERFLETAKPDSSAPAERPANDANGEEPSHD